MSNCVEVTKKTSNDITRSTVFYCGSSVTAYYGGKKTKEGRI
jgi:hypothetical protein